jgi:hypothetical protein
LSVAPPRLPREIPHCVHSLSQAETGIAIARLWASRSGAGTRRAIRSFRERGCAPLGWDRSFIRIGRPLVIAAGPSVGAVQTAISRNIPRSPSIRAVRCCPYHPLTCHSGSSRHVLIRLGGSSKLMMPVRSWSAALFEPTGDGKTRVVVCHSTVGRSGVDHTERLIGFWRGPVPPARAHITPGAMKLLQP